MQAEEMERQFTIRRADVSDAMAIANLLTILGHPTTPYSIESRWHLWMGAGNLALVAVNLQNEIVGTATLHEMVVLHRPKPVGRITALVIAPNLRGQGIGSALVHHAETYFTDRGCGILEITSNQKLTQAHAFYEKLGFERTSIRLAKQLDTP